MPIHGSTPWLMEAIKSSMEQTAVDIRLLICVDRFALDLEATLKSLSKKELGKLLVLKSPGSGISAALNHAILHADSDIVFRHDSDDVMFSNRIKTQLDFLLSNPSVGLLGTQMELCDQNLKKIGITKYPVTHSKIVSALSFYNCLGHPSIAFRKALFDQVGGYDSNQDGREDYDLWLKMSQKTKVANIGSVLVKYRIHDHQVSRAESTSIKEAHRSLVASQIDWKQKQNRVSSQPYKALHSLYLHTIVKGRIHQQVYIALALPNLRRRFVQGLLTLGIEEIQVILKMILILFSYPRLTLKIVKEFLRRHSVYES
jgi:glycosyltransferase involved in cell wall biosynthesis